MGNLIRVQFANKITWNFVLEGVQNNISTKL